MNLLLLVAVACASPGGSVSSQEDPPILASERAPEPSMQIPEEVRAWAEAEHGDAARITRLGEATGHPAFVVTVGARGERPRVRVPVVLRGEEVLVGRSGWRVFLGEEGREDPERVAAAWLVLHQGEVGEPFGRDRPYKDHAMPDPAWRGERLVLHTSGPRSVPRVVELEIDDHGAVTVVAEGTWTPPSPF